MTKSQFSKYFFLAFLFIILFGFVVPAALSDPSDFGVCVGVLIVLGTIYGVGYVLLPTRNKNQEERRP